ncbi:hypothetical protein KJ628_03445 [Patescibacteria group bacterium]|nr:hypothetical protein [Patescibacteria group bacterium]
MASLTLAFGGEESPDSRTKGEHRASVTIRVASGETIKRLGISRPDCRQADLAERRHSSLAATGDLHLNGVVPYHGDNVPGLDRSLSKTESGLRVVQFYEYNG